MAISSDKLTKSHTKRQIWLRKGNLERDSESFLIAAQNNNIITNCIKAKIDNKQKNSKRRLCCDRDEIINHVVSECSRLVQRRYKIRHGWVG